MANSRDYIVLSSESDSADDQPVHLLPPLKEEDEDVLEEPCEQADQLQEAPLSNEAHIDDDDADDGSLDVSAMFTVLLNNPDEHELQSRPSGIRSNQVFTLNSEKFSLDQAKADGNGAYRSGGSRSRFYFVEVDESMEVVSTKRAHKESGSYIVKEQVNRKTTTTTRVPDSSVFELCKRYRTSVMNPFRQLIVTARRVDCKDPLRHFLVIYRWADGKVHSEDDFIVPRHGNARKPHAAAYQRQDPEIFERAKRLLKEQKAPAKVYNTLIQQAQLASKEPRNPKMVYNIKERMKSNDENNSKQSLTECEALVQQMREVDYIQSVTLTPEQYVSFNSTEQMWVDVERFCVKGSQILLVDTTFQLADGLWLTDSSYGNESLVNSDGLHPEFPGPYMWHFKKDRTFYRRFASEMVCASPSMAVLPRIGHDLDQAIVGGFSDVFRNDKHFFCTEHLQNADVRKLKAMGVNSKTIAEIMASIYGSQTGPLCAQGLADADDADHFDDLLESLKAKWEELLPGFHQWWGLQRSDVFKSNLVISSRRDSGITGRFYTNKLELIHKLQKKALADSGVASKSVTEVNEVLHKWVLECSTEAVRAIRGLGKFRLAPGFESFYVEPSIWNRWGLQRQQQHVEKFFAARPSATAKYTKPATAGLKAAPQAKRRARQPEPELFEDAAGPSSSKTVTPVKLARKSDNQWTVQERAENKGFDLLNPFRVIGNSYVLVHRKDGKNCPTKVTRCECCRRQFLERTDVVIVKTEGNRKFTDRDGKKKKYRGNVYLHFLEHCLKEYDQKFSFNMVTVLGATLDLLPAGASEQFTRLGCQIE